MEDHLKFYIDGRWVDPIRPCAAEVIDPSTEVAIARISMGSAADVDVAVAAARRAFERYAETTREERVALLEHILEEYKKRYDDVATAISREMGAPIRLAKRAQAAMGVVHLESTIQVLKEFSFIQERGTSAELYEPIGVVGMITPWNWPINQIMCKLAPALAAGCTMILKPSEIASLSALVLAEILEAAGVPAGVFNLINGAGASVGAAMSGHPRIDMITFTGSTGAGIAVAKSAADTVKRVAQELGGKSANILLDDVDLDKAVSAGIRACFINTGQSCNAPTRMFVPRKLQPRAIEIAKQTVAAIEVGDPNAEGRHLGPLSSQAQFDKVQQLIQQGVDEGATLVAGGTGRPAGFTKGYYVKPTVFADVRNEMVIAQQEVFGPVLAILPYDTDDDAVRMANDSPYGLSGYVQSSDLNRARRVAARLRTGSVHLNGAGPDPVAPFGGYKQSGNGREWGEHGFREFLEVKSVLGYSS